MRGHLDRWIKALILANVVLLAVVLSAVFFDSFHGLTPGHPAQAASSPSASIELMPMGLAHIPTSDACVLCHDSGGQAGLKPVPALGHPLEGWRECLTCHTNDKLGRTAPGHVGIPQTECLNCHKVAQPGPAITQPHSRLGDQHCLDCHGSVAHLPSSMVGRNQSDCSLCHKPTALPPPQYPHAPGANLDCRSCHQSAEVGNLPIDHALRTNEMCLLCHDIRQQGSSPLPSSSPAVTPRPKASTLGD